MTLLVASLGYFVDIFDLTMFSIVRIPSLAALGVSPADSLTVGARILSLQQAGLLIGGIAWGMLGDRRGRVEVLFSSILLYSLATIFSGLATSVPVYGAMRFAAGLGLAAELGAAVTLVGESLPAKSRGWGTALVGATGLLGAVAASLMAMNLSWRTCYLFGGGMGLLLMAGRYSVRESGLFRALAGKTGMKRGDLLLLFSSPERALRYTLCILAGLPICASIGILVYFSPELARSAGATGTVSAGTAVMAAYIGMSLGDLSCTALSQFLKSRRTAAASFIIFLGTAMAGFTGVHGPTPAQVYLICGVLGLASGYWIILVTSAAEQFGTNLRATVTTSVPNLVRGLNGPLALAFAALAPAMGAPQAAGMMAGICVAVGLLAVYFMKESFGKSLRYTEK
jgi:hypothetical protein